MSTALAPAGTTALSALPTPVEWDSIRSMGAMAAQSQLVPQHFRGKPADCVIALLTARELGIGGMVALQKGFVIGGKFDVEVSVKAGIVQSRVPDFDYEVLALDAEKCTVKGGRAGKQQHTVTFTIEQAKKAGLLSKDTWQNYAEDMLHNRALGRLLKRTCAAALYNMPMALDVDEEPGAIEPTHEASVATVIEPAAPAPPPPATPQPTELRPTQQDAIRFFALMAEHGWPVGKPPGEHKNAVTKFVKANEKIICNVASVMYGELGTPRTVSRYIEIAPLDWKALVGAFEAWAAKKKAAGNGTDGTGDTEVPPAATVPESSAEVVDEGDAEIPDAAPAPATQVSAPFVPPAPYEILANMGVDGIVEAMNALRLASKNQRKFYGEKPEGQFWIIDSKLLVELGSTKLDEASGRQVPVVANVATLCESNGTRFLLCDLLCKIAEAEGVRLV